MTEPLSIEPRSSALLVMDFQVGILGSVEDKASLLERTSRLLGAARSAGLRVVYVRVGFRDGYPELSAQNAGFSSLRSAGRFLESDAGTGIEPLVLPHAGDVVVTKHRVSGFAGTDLEMILRASSIQTLILAGVATSGVVLSTLRHAADADYRIVVVADCCADRDAEVHRVLTEKIFPRQASVVSADAACAAMAPA